MYQPLPALTEDVDVLQTRWRHERAPQLRPRLHLLVRRKSGQGTTRRQAAAPLAVHRHTSTGWRRQYRHGGLAGLLTSKEPGAPAGQKTLPPTVFAQLPARLAPPTGFASYGAMQQWLREALALAGPQQTLHGIVRYQLKAKRQRPRPSPAKQTPRPRRILFSRAPAAWAPALPQGGTPPTNPCGSSARMQVVEGCPGPSTGGSPATA